MKITDKLKKIKPYYRLAFAISILAIIYFIMTFILGLYHWSKDSTFTPIINLHYGISWLIFKSSAWPLNVVWTNIPAIPLHDINVVEFYKVVVPPAALFTICMIYMSYYRALKDKFNRLNAKVNNEIELNEMRESKGLKQVTDNATIDVIISDTSKIDPLWYESFIGKVITGVLIALIITALSLK